MDNDLVDRIKNFNAHRNQSVLPIKYNIIAQNPFCFLRGTCHLFYQDLLKNYPFDFSPLSWICGDLHIENFGSYKGENRLLYFDMNDFDESILAPILFEIARLVVSVEIKCTQIKYSSEQKKEIIAKLLQQYRNELINNKSQVVEQETATGLIKKLIDKVAERKNMLIIARTNNKFNNAKLLITDNLLPIEADKKKQLVTEFAPWFTTNHHKGFKVTDAGFRIAGTGSIGIQRYLCLLQNEKNPKQKKLIDIKQAAPSCILNYTKLEQPVWQNEADRVVKTQQMMQHVSPAFLSAFNFDNNVYIVKQLQPTSDKIIIQKNTRQNGSMLNYVEDLAMVTASAQLRSSGRLQSATADNLKEFALNENWIKPLTEWSLHYAEIVRKNYNEYYNAWKVGYFKI